MIHGERLQAGRDLVEALVMQDLVFQACMHRDSSMPARIASVSWHLGSMQRC